MRVLITPTCEIRIYLAGDVEVAKQLLRRECYERPFCVTVTSCDYIYTGGEEAGYVVGLVNYPRFPSNPVDLMARAREIATLLMGGTYQHSALIVTPGDTIWLTKREDDHTPCVK